MINSEQAGNYERVKTTVLFADIVNSTELLVRIGDEHWARVLKKYYALARNHISFFDGQLLSTSGDGFHASFASSQLAARCAIAVRISMNALGLRLRIGLHSGECVRLGGLLVGLTVHISARIAAAARADEVLLSDSVREHLAGSEHRLIERGSYYLKGLPGEWRLFNYDWIDQAR
jgi:class 3 adenylate cyclase